MTNVIERHQRRPELSKLTDVFTGFPSWPTWWPMMSKNHFIRLEEEVSDGRYVVHAEMPGVDPAKDVDITVADGLLTITAERGERTEADGRSEFTYGSFLRTVPLPAGADEDDIKASYDKGILTIEVALSAPSKPPVKHVPVIAAN